MSPYCGKSKEEKLQNRLRHVGLCIICQIFLPFTCKCAVYNQYINFYFIYTLARILNGGGGGGGKWGMGGGGGGE